MPQASKHVLGDPQETMQSLAGQTPLTRQRKACLAQDPAPQWAELPPCRVEGANSEIPPLSRETEPKPSGQACVLEDRLTPLSPGLPVWLFRLPTFSIVQTSKMQVNKTSAHSLPGSDLARSNPLPILGVFTRLGERLLIGHCLVFSWGYPCPPAVCV